MARKGEGFHSAVAYNTHQPRAAHSTTQFGGCSTSAFNEVSHRVRSSGVDSLGRWAWIRLQGRTQGVGQRDLVVISAYRPNPPNDGHQTVWFQHNAHFSRTNRDAEPREAFIKDLSTAINKWRDDGCSIILGIDAKDDLSSYSPKSFRFRMSEVGLVEAIQSKHPGSHQATYQRNLRGYLIDSIFATPDVPILAAGYYPFDEHVTSDHRGLWIDFDLNRLLGGHHEIHPCSTPAGDAQQTGGSTICPIGGAGLYAVQYSGSSLYPRIRCCPTAGRHHQIPGGQIRSDTR
ncbi:unnamed protein product [Cylindrotheca closterium]|uniref:Endonuclease/exonuclease/phosphatase domain-containing protein n=1 Tax=Cylindrotheca closterium TaxID=2856 RepID=A0AAD2FKU9_9STRA|nr:unnamed protein product [Cylindrotheca closterium]